VQGDAGQDDTAGAAAAASTIPANAGEAVASAEGALAANLPDVSDVEIEVVELANGMFVVCVLGLPDLRRAWEALRSAKSSTGLWPIIATGPDLFRQGDRGRADSGGTALDQIDERNRPHRDEHEDLDPSDWVDWDEVDPQHRFAFEDRGFFFSGDGWLALFPVQHGWEVLEATGWSDGNGLHNWVHRDIARRWEERHGAELALIDTPSVEFFLPTPVFDPEQAVELAWELHGYGDEVGLTSRHEVDEIASSLLVSSVWRFWWD
jgi:hypothetical protein